MSSSVAKRSNETTTMLLTISLGIRSLNFQNHKRYFVLVNINFTIVSTRIIYRTTYNIIVYNFKLVFLVKFFLNQVKLVFFFFLLRPLKQTIYYNFNHLNDLLKFDRKSTHRLYVRIRWD